MSVARAQAVPRRHRVDGAELRAPLAAEIAVAVEAEAARELQPGADPELLLQPPDVDLARGARRPTRRAQARPVQGLVTELVARLQRVRSAEQHPVVAPRRLDLAVPLLPGDRHHLPAWKDLRLVTVVPAVGERRGQRGARAGHERQLGRQRVARQVAPRVVHGRGELRRSGEEVVGDLAPRVVAKEAQVDAVAHPQVGRAAGVREAALGLPDRLRVCRVEVESVVGAVVARRGEPARSLPEPDGVRHAHVAVRPARRGEAVPDAGVGGLSRDQVDDAAEGIRPVECRGRPLDDLDPVDPGQLHVLEVQVPVGVLAQEPAAVHEHQHAAVGDAVQRDVALAPARLHLHAAARLLHEQVLGAARARVLDLRPVDERGRVRDLEQQLLAAVRGGDGDRRGELHDREHHVHRQLFAGRDDDIAPPGVGEAGQAGPHVVGPRGEALEASVPLVVHPRRPGGAVGTPGGDHRGAGQHAGGVHHADDERAGFLGRCARDGDEDRPQQEGGYEASRAGGTRASGEHGGTSAVVVRSG